MTQTQTLVTPGTPLFTLNFHPLRHGLSLFETWGKSSLLETVGLRTRLSMLRLLLLPYKNHFNFGGFLTCKFIITLPDPSSSTSVYDPTFFSEFFSDLSPLVRNS